MSVRIRNYKCENYALGAMSIAKEPVFRVGRGTIRSC